jgi:hypothetical protein
MFKDVKADLYWTGEMGHVSPGLRPLLHTPKDEYVARFQAKLNTDIGSRIVMGFASHSNSLATHSRYRRCVDTLAPSSGDDASRIARRPLSSYQHGTWLPQRSIEGQASGRVECARRAGWVGGRRQREG